MPEVFVNYRTGDGDKTAALIANDLSHRFGEEHIFRASASIRPGMCYPEELLNNVRRSDVMLAVIGPGWTRFPALYDGNDWVRREILEALAYGVPIIPVLEGRGTERLVASDLPAELQPLADRQSERLDLHQVESGLDRIAKRLMELVPNLRDRTAAGTDSGSTHNQVRDVRGGTIVQSRDITGDVGTVIKGPGPFHLGKGDIYNNSRHFSGDGVAYVEGDNKGGIRFGDSKRAGEDDDR